jgi:sugar-phosphatase
MIELSDFDAVIFDMDGVLINSEPFWLATEIEVFATVGIDFLKVGGEQTVGLRIDEVIDYWYDRYLWDNLSKSDVLQQIMEQMIEKVETKGESMTGVSESLRYFKAQGKKIGLASSSLHQLIEAVLDRLEIVEYFDVINSAEGLAYGKPHPEIYMKTAAELDVLPARCLVIEDSVNGIISAKAAKMKVVAIPDGTHNFDDKIKVADQIETNLIALINTLKN